MNSRSDGINLKQGATNTVFKIQDSISTQDGFIENDTLGFYDFLVQGKDFLNEPTIADAILDRLVPKAHRVELMGKSLRTKSENLF